MNYALWGHMFKLCNNYNTFATEAAAKRKVSIWKIVAYGGAMQQEANAFVSYGYNGGSLPASGQCAGCSMPARSSPIDLMTAISSPWTFETLHP